MRRVIGIDFDHTLVSYDQPLRSLARELGFEERLSKTEFRDALRRSPEGDIAWQRVQAQLYGPRMGEATPMEGAMEFLQVCVERGWTVHIVSHKTQYAAYDPAKTDLREAALAWILHTKLPIPIEHVHFASTRKEKLDFIRHLNCQCFIDDLVEVFLEPDFPLAVERILFSTAAPANLDPTVQVFGTWPEIQTYVVSHGD